LEIAKQSFYRQQISVSKDTAMVKSYQMMLDILNTKLNPFLPSPKSVKRYAGNYSGSIVKIEKGDLYFTPSDGYKVKLIALSQTVFAFNNWKLGFVLRKNGTVSQIELISLSQDKQILQRQK
jgi:hypothetical protein